MTDTPELASLTIKDLRQLAGEHNIQNRSRLGKEELIQALQEALSSRGTQLTEAKAAEAAASAGETASERDTDHGDDADDEVAPIPSQPLSDSGAEPEMITPESVAMLAERPAEGASRDDAAGDDQDDEDDEESPAQTPSEELPWPENLMYGDGGGRRRRRRRRGRGRRDGDDRREDEPGQDRANGAAHPAPGADASQDQDEDQDQAESDEAGHDRGDEPPQRAEAQPQPQRVPQAQPQRAPQQERHQQRQPQQPQPQSQQPHRPPRPRLDGPQRPVPSVLDRLCTFSKGILDLCSPDTPSWAQPRLSELLAEAGMVMVPVQGQPHAEFHEVVGTIATKQVPPGHIAEMVSPGFALRGDRGDLFALKRARVRVAEGGAPVPPRGPDHDQPQPEHEPSGRDDSPASESDLDQGEAVEGDHAEPPVVAEPPSEPDNRDGAREQRHDARPSGGHPSDGRHAPRIAPRAPQPPPAAGRPPLRTHPREPATSAPRLPLAPQVPDELAARPKAEGFRALGLNDQILADLAAIGYEKPTPIQEEAIPVVLSGKDLMGQAQTGTGKTAAFALPILQNLYRFEGQGPVALVLCPTRELARQVHGEFTRMAGASGARAVVIYGGVPMDDQIRGLEREPHVVVGTPGRIIDHMRRHTLDLSRLKVAVLDEADQMLDIGFWPDVNYIISHTPPARQMLLFSATFPDPVKQLAAKHMKEPAHIRIQPAQVTVEQVDQKYIAVPREKKNELLAHFIETQNPEQLVVFCKTKHQTDRVAEVLKRKHMSAAAIHGDLPQSKREKTLQAFRNRELQCLIATNVAARGLDIPTVSHVLNYDIPEAPEEYVHRIGRTARNGAKGVARTFITPEDGQFLVEIEKHIGLLLEEEKVEGFTPEASAAPIKRTIAEAPVGRILKPLVGGIRLGRRR
jgi:ATP-dependent RNA helicase DeaD